MGTDLRLAATGPPRFDGAAVAVACVQWEEIIQLSRAIAPGGKFLGLQSSMKYVLTLQLPSCLQIWKQPAAKKEGPQKAKTSGQIGLCAAVNLSELVPGINSAHLLAVADAAALFVAVATCGTSASPTATDGDNSDGGGGGGAEQATVHRLRLFDAAPATVRRRGGGSPALPKELEVENPTVATRIAAIATHRDFIVVGTASGELVAWHWRNWKLFPFRRINRRRRQRSKAAPEFQRVAAIAVPPEHRGGINTVAMSYAVRECDRRMLAFSGGSMVPASATAGAAVGAVCVWHISPSGGQLLHAFTSPSLASVTCLCLARRTAKTAAAPEHSAKPRRGREQQGRFALHPEDLFIAGATQAREANDAGDPESGTDVKLLAISGVNAAEGKEGEEGGDGLQISLTERCDIGTEAAGVAFLVEGRGEAMAATAEDSNGGFLITGGQSGALHVWMQAAVTLPPAATAAATAAPAATAATVVIVAAVRRGVLLCRL